ncbi:MAG: hypothetical protein HOP28_03720 [Gemmatimonadales bacterium]|nr:hypothetical protein [Gemmatimonadales bacterium]
MSTVTKFFFRAPYVPKSTWAVLQWWESRRLVYNLAVGTAGLLTLTALSFLDALPPLLGGGRFRPPFLFIVAYGLLANLFFSAGPVVDALICRRWGPDFASLGPAIFRYGFAFAVGLTLLPIPMVLLAWGFRLLRWLL